MVELRDRFLDVAGLKLHELRGGSAGPEVVLLHGGGTNSAQLCWSRCLPELASSCRVHAPDFPGFGESAPQPRCTLDGLVRCAEGYLDAIGAGRPVVVAHSMAGLVALELAARRPQRLAGLVLVDALGLGARVPYLPLVWLATKWPPFHPAILRLSRRVPALLSIGLRYNLADPGARRDPELIADLLAEMERPGAGRAWNEFLADQNDGGLFRGDEPERLARLQLPVLLIHGDRDRLVSVRSSREAVRRMPDARLVELPRCGHWPSREQPEVVSAQIAEFAREASRAHSE